MINSSDFNRHFVNAPEIKTELNVCTITVLKVALLFDIFNAFQIRKQYLSSNVLKKVLLHVASFMYLNLYEMCLKKQISILQILLLESLVQAHSR